MVKLMQIKNKQFILTIPKIIVQANHWKKGEKLYFIFDRGDVILKKKET